MNIDRKLIREVTYKLINDCKIYNSNCINLSGKNSIPEKLCIRIAEKDLGKGAVAMIVVRNKRAIITIEKNEPYKYRNRFSIAHEIGHFLLHLTNGMTMRTCSELDMAQWNQLMHKSNEKEEIEANIFASELLMPKAFVEKKIDLKDVSFRTISEISKEFRTTFLASAVRFIDLTNENCALIYSQDSQIKWFKKSDSCKYFFQLGRNLDCETVAYQFFNGKRLTGKPEIIKASAWINNAKDDERITEISIGLKKLSASISFIFEEKKLAENDLSKPYYYLTKSDFMAGYQCEKRFYFDMKKPKEFLETYYSNDNDEILLWNLCFEKAQSLFPNGKLIKNDILNDDILETKSYLKSFPYIPLFKAAFISDDIFTRSDILYKSSNGYNLIKVTRSTGVKDYHLIECAFKAWVIENCGYQLENIQIAYINKGFIYQGDDDYSGLFKFESVTDKVLPIKKEIHNKIKELRQVLISGEPKKEIGEHCYNFIRCPYITYCKKASKFPINTLYRIKKDFAKSLIEKGIDDIRGIQEDSLTTPIHKRMYNSIIKGTHEINIAVAQQLKKHPFPYYYLDFETHAYPVPIWINTSPYKNYLPFQWSLHIEDKNNNVYHKEFLDLSGKDIRKELILKLIDALGDNGPIFVYSSFEKSVLNELKITFNDLSPKIESLIIRLVDLLPIVRENYYHPKMQGSFSLKSVLPTIAPELSYKNISLNNGISASLAYLEAIQQKTTTQRREEIKQDLLEYCKMDTKALVKIVAFLKNSASIFNSKI
ncbi:MAG: DUF2779 domain-containing protein [Desulfobacterales bacterium]|nr:DUF2779 domain-containing protein [Desulfobacterales bacterium]